MKPGPGVLLLLAALAETRDCTTRTLPPLAPLPPLASSPAPPPASAAPTRAGLPAPKPLVLKATRLLVPRTGQLIEPVWVELAGGQVAHVLKAAPATTAEVIDLGDATLLPGLVDAHTHLLHAETADEASIIVEATTMTEADRALRGVSHARQMLAAGFTTVRDLGNAGRSGDVALRRAIREGYVEGPTMLISTRALAPPGGQFPHLNPASAALVEQEYATVHGPDEGRALVTQAFFEGADWIKVIVDHGPGRTLGEAELRAIVETAHRSSRKVAAHVLTAPAAALAVEAGVDSLEHAYRIDDATLTRMGKKKIALVPTDYPLDFYARFAPAQEPARSESLASFRRLRESAIDRLRRAKRARVPIVAGSDAYTVTDLADRGQEAALIFRAYAESGLSPLEVVQAATTSAADLLAPGARVGVVEDGGPADIIAVRGDPSHDLEALSRVVLVVKGGRVVHRAP